MSDAAETPNKQLACGACWEQKIRLPSTSFNRYENNPLIMCFTPCDEGDFTALELENAE